MGISAHNIYFSGCLRERFSKRGCCATSGKGGDAFLTLSENFYSLKVIYPQPCMDPAEAYLAKRRKAGAYLDKPEDNIYLPQFYIDWITEQDYMEMCYVPESYNQCALAKMMTLRVTSPVFCVDEEQEIVLHFDGLKVSRILLNDKECSFIQKTITASWTKRFTYRSEPVEVVFCSIIL